MSRGKKKPSLRDLSKEQLATHELTSFQKELIEGTDRSAALVACAMVDAALFRALATRMVFHNEDDEVEGIFFKTDAPLGSLSARTRMGVAMGLFLPEVARVIDTIRRIRNAFAHSVKPIPFSHELVVSEINKLPEGKHSPESTRETIQSIGLDAQHMSEYRHRYLSACATLAIALERYTIQASGAGIPVIFEKWTDVLSWREKSERQRRSRSSNRG